MLVVFRNHTAPDVWPGTVGGSIAYRKELRGVLKGPALFYWNVEKG